MSTYDMSYMSMQFNPPSYTLPLLIYVYLFRSKIQLMPMEFNVGALVQCEYLEDIWKIHSFWEDKQNVVLLHAQNLTDTSVVPLYSLHHVDMTPESDRPLKRARKTLSSSS